MPQHPAGFAVRISHHEIQKRIWQTGCMNYIAFDNTSSSTRVLVVAFAVASRERRRWYRQRGYHDNQYQQRSLLAHKASLHRLTTTLIGVQARKLDH